MKFVLLGLVTVFAFGEMARAGLDSPSLRPKGSYGGELCEGLSRASTDPVITYYGFANWLNLKAETAIDTSAKLVSALKAAFFRGDLKYMRQAKTELERFLCDTHQKRIDLYPMVCDYECHLYRGRYHLFMASDVAYLGEADSSGALSIAWMEEQITAGLKIVDSAVNLLALAPSTDEAGTPLLGEQNRRLGETKRLQAMLLMLAGDLIYQSYSETVVEQPPQQSGVDGELSKAYGYYEAAMWMVIESLSDFPPSDRSQIKTDLAFLREDIKTRLESVENGHLFLGIDPLAPVSESIADLRRRLLQLHTQISGYETSIRDSAAAWKVEQANEGDRKRQKELDEDRYLNNQALALKGHQLAKVQAEMESALKAMSTKYADYEGKQEGAEKEAAMFDLRFSVEQEMRSVEQRIALIKARKEADLIAFSLEDAQERKTDLRWLIGHTIAESNYRIQVKVLETEMIELNRAKAANSAKLASLANQREQLVKEIAKAVNIENMLVNHIESLNHRKIAEFEAEDATYIHQYCGLRQQAFYLDPAQDVVEPKGQNCAPALRPEMGSLDYQRRIAEARVSLEQETIHGTLYQLRCVLEHPIENPPGTLAPDCSGQGSMRGILKKQFEVEEKAAKSKIDLIEKQVQGFKTAAKSLHTFIAAGDVVRRKAEELLNTLEAGLQSVTKAAAVFTVSGALAGPSGGGILLTVDQSAQTAANTVRQNIDAIRERLARAAQWDTIKSEVEGRANEMLLKITALNNDLERLKNEDAIRFWAQAQLMAEFVSKVKLQELGLQSAVIKSGIVRMDGGLSEQSIRARHVEILDELKHIEAQRLHLQSVNDSLDFEMADTRLKKANAVTEQEILGLKVKELEIQVASIGKDDQYLESLMENVLQRGSILEAGWRTVAGIERQLNESESQIALLKRQHRDKSMAINDEEISGLERIMRDQTLYLQAKTTEFGRMKSLLADKADLAQEIGQLEQSLIGAVIQGHEELGAAVEHEMTKGAKWSADNEAERMTARIATEAELSDLFLGVRDYVRIKRRTLDYANADAYKMRRRFDMLTGQSLMATNSQLFFRNSDQLAQFLTPANNKIDATDVNFSTGLIKIPATSALGELLVQRGMGTFMVSYPGNAPVNMDAGYMNIDWPLLVDQGGQRILGIGVGLTTNNTDCDTLVADAAIRHLGDGMAHRQSWEPYATTPLTTEPGVLRTSDIHGPWLNNNHERRYRVLALENSLSTDEKVPLASFAGAPLFASYRIRVYGAQGVCDLSTATWWLKFIYSRYPYP